MYSQAIKGEFSLTEEEAREMIRGLNHEQLLDLLKFLKQLKSENREP